LRIAARGGLTDVRAVALVRDAYGLLFRLEMRGSALMNRLILGAPALGRLAQAPPGLPDAMLLVLDTEDTVRLVALRTGLRPRPDREIARWAVDEVAVAIETPRPHGVLAAVTINDGERDLLVAAPWRARRQRAALRFIEYCASPRVEVAA
jgi:hypothetical protein